MKKPPPLPAKFVMGVKVPPRVPMRAPELDSVPMHERTQTTGMLGPAPGVEGPPPDVDSEPEWERKTDAQIRLIERRGPPVTYPPESTVGKRWSPAGVVMVIGAVSALSVTLGAVLGPFFTKPDLSGYVKEERLQRCEAKMDARQEAHDKASEELRRQTGKCYQALGDCRSQNGAQEQVIESMGTKRRER